MNFRFSAANEWNFSERLSKLGNNSIDCSQHLDQLFYMFRLSSDPDIVSDAAYQNIKSGSIQRKIITSTIDFYANFMKFGWAADTLS